MQWEIVKIKRTDNKNRIRPDGSDRHQAFNSRSEITDKLSLIDDRDIEWLAWNYRSYKYSQMFDSKSNMIF